MARYYRRRYTRVVKPKKKWASCINVWNGDPINSPYVITLAANQAQKVLAVATTPTPTIVKVGNFKISVDFDATVTAAAGVSMNAVVYILFVPEGIQDDNVGALITTHPEYIMATKVVGASITASTSISLETVNLSTRMKRNLNSGDKVVMYVDFRSKGGTVIGSLIATGNVRYWVCNN